MFKLKNREFTYTVDDSNPELAEMPNWLNYKTSKSAKLAEMPN